MKYVAFSFGLLALGLAATTPARADYALVRFDDGWCKIWWDSNSTPPGVGWAKIRVGIPDWETANAVLNQAVGTGECR